MRSGSPYEANGPDSTGTPTCRCVLTKDDMPNLQQLDMNSPLARRLREKYRMSNEQLNELLIDIALAERRVLCDPYETGDDCGNLGEVTVYPTAKRIAQSPDEFAGSTIPDDGVDMCSKHAGDLVDPEEKDMQGLWTTQKPK